MKQFSGFQTALLSLGGGLALGALGGCVKAAQTPLSTQQAPGPGTTTPRKAPAQSNATGQRISYREEVPNGAVQSNGLTVPRGFIVEEMVGDLTQPRRIAFAPGGTPQKYDVFIAESSANRIRVLRVEGGKVVGTFIYSDKLSQPYGLAFHPSGWLYVGNTDAVVRLPYTRGAVKTAAAPQQISQLTEGGYNQHWTRNLLFSRDAKKLYVTVGSSCNTCEESDSQRAAISVMNPDGSERRLFAEGLRNPVGIAWRSGTNELWTVVNERDNLGDNVPPDYLTQVRDGGFYGWPYAYTDIHRTIVPDPTFGAKNPAKVKATLAPTVPVQAHSAALGVAFYPTVSSDHLTRRGTQYFPPEYSGNAFLAFHGSWNRSAKTGYKIVRVKFAGGKPVEVSDFVRGFLRDGDQAWGRPVDVQIAPDGSLLFSDDGGGKIWRVRRSRS